MRAILQVSDTGPLESLVIMLRSVGIKCLTPNEALKKQLREAGCDMVLDIASLVNGMGYSQPMLLDEATPEDMSAPDVIYVDIKAHRNTPKVLANWPRLANRTIWARINGGRPEHVVNARGDMGDEINPPCPILTPNLWYRETHYCTECKAIGRVYTESPRTTGALCSCGRGATWAPWADKAYACWPPFYRFDEYLPVHGRIDGYTTMYEPPICLIHNLEGWGYQKLVPEMRDLGVKCYGAGSPDGLINHAKVAKRLSEALAMVHLKSSDAPGYALYEALAAGCPIICTRRLIWRNRMEELLIPGETCLVFDRETHDGLSDKDVRDCTMEVKEGLDILSNPGENRRIGLAGRRKLNDLMWSESKEEDRASLTDFLRRNVGL